MVTLREGSGVILINNESIAVYFPRAADRQQVLYPLVAMEMLGKYDITASVRGGGITGALNFP